MTMPRFWALGLGAELDVEHPAANIPISATPMTVFGITIRPPVRPIPLPTDHRAGEGDGAVGYAPDHRLSGYPLGWPTNDPPPDNEAHAIRIRTVEVWERATLIMLGIAQKEDPTRGATSMTVH